MGKVKSLVMDQEEMFWNDAERLVKASKKISEAVFFVDLLRSDVANWLEASVVEDAVVNLWSDTGKGEI
jgi:hypothetical protein